MEEEVVIVRSDRVTPEKLKWYDQFAPYSWLCYDFNARKRAEDIDGVEEIRRRVKLSDQMNLIDFKKEPFTNVIKNTEDWMLYVLQPFYFLVCEVEIDGRLYQPISYINLQSQKSPIWITEDIEKATDYSERIAKCPNCCPDELPWPAAAIAVPVSEIAQHFLGIGWDKRIVDEVVLRKGVDWSQRRKLPLDKDK